MSITAKLNIKVQLSFSSWNFFFGCIPIIVVWGSSWSSKFNFLKDLLFVFQNGCIRIYSPSSIPGLHCCYTHVFSNTLSFNFLLWMKSRS
jgi:hypothetical protein